MEKLNLNNDFLKYYFHQIKDLIRKKPKFKVHKKTRSSNF